MSLLDCVCVCVCVCGGSLIVADGELVENFRYIPVTCERRILNGGGGGVSVENPPRMRIYS